MTPPSGWLPLGSAQSLCLLQRSGDPREQPGHCKPLDLQLGCVISFGLWNGGTVCSWGRTRACCFLLTTPGLPGHNYATIGHFSASYDYYSITFSTKLSFSFQKMWHFSWDRHLFPWASVLGSLRIYTKGSSCGWQRVWLFYFYIWWNEAEFKRIV